jgi:hypothetical protein
MDEIIKLISGSAALILAIVGIFIAFLTFMPARPAIWRRTP